MPKKPLKKKPIKKVLKQKQKQSQKQVVNVNIQQALRNAVRRRSKPLAKKIIQPTQITQVFRVNEPSAPYFQPFFSEPMKVEKSAANVEQPAVNVQKPVRLEQQVFFPFEKPLKERKKQFTEPRKEESLSDSEFDYESANQQTPIRQVREKLPAIYGSASGAGSGKENKLSGKNWIKSEEGRKLLKEGVPIPEGSFWNEITGRFNIDHRSSSNFNV